MKYLMILFLCIFVVYAEEPISFIVMGDMPYTERDKVTLSLLKEAIPLLKPSILIHYGDLKGGGESCTNTLLKDRRDQINALLPHRVVYTPGDNEWTDCDRKYLSEIFDERERLSYLRRLFYYDKNSDLSGDIPNLVRQQGQIENSMWKIGSLQMGTLHIVGTNNGRVDIRQSDVNTTLDDVDKRDSLNRIWLKSIFENASGAEGVVIAFQADIYRFKGDAPACTKENRVACNPYRNIREDLKHLVKDYRKPVLVLHGDTHPYCFNQPYEELPNFWHLNGPGDFKVSDAAKVVFDPESKDKPFTVNGVIHTGEPPVECNYKRKK